MSDVTDIVERLRGFSRTPDPREAGGELSTREIRLLVAALDAADEIERLWAEVVAFRKAITDGVGPFCEDVCLVQCLGVCGA